MTRARPLALVGLRCAGKTTVGKVLARRLDRVFVDHDERTLQRAHHAGLRVASVGELLRRHPVRFRDLEAQALREILEPGLSVVIATGGGCVERSDNRVWLARAAWTVWLRVDPGVLRERMARDGTERPALEGGDPFEEVERIARARESLYAAVADATVDASALPPEEVADRIRELLPTA